MKEQIKNVHADADALDLRTAIEAQPKVSKAASTKNFCSTYQKTVRPALLIGLSLVKIFHRGDVADGIAQAIAFLDLTCGGDTQSSGI